MQSLIPEILFEDKQLLVLNKPAGLMTEEDRFNHPSAMEWASVYLKSIQRGEIFVANVHRLDRPASGVLVLVKKRSALKVLSSQFQNREVEKIYFAITEKAPEEKHGHLIHWLRKDPKEKKAAIYDREVKDSDRVELFYEIVSNHSQKFLWRIRLITGKYHQIRAQLGHMQCAIVGDEKYGSFITLSGERICLHSGQLSFKHPLTNSSLEVKAPFPFFDPWNLFVQ